jgi:uncharacterized protein DUF6636
VKALIVAVGALACVGAAGAAVPTPNPVQTGFNVPSGNMVCNGGPYRGGHVLACAVFSEASARGQKLWSMRPSGRVSVGFLKSNAATDFPVLRYGRSRSWLGIRCTSRRSGLTCTNQSRHGFVLSRQSQRVF